MLLRIIEGKIEPATLNLTYEQIERWKNENDEWVLPQSFEIKNSQNKVVATVNPQAASINDNELTWSREGTQQNPITLQYNETDGYYVQSTFEYPTKNVKIKQIDTSIIPSGGDPPITIDNVVLTENGQYLPSDFDPTTGQLLPEGQTSNAEYFTSVEVATNPLPLDPNQPPLTSNGQYTIYDKDADEDMDIVESNQQPQPQRKMLFMTRDVIDDQSYKNIGTFTVNVPQQTINNYSQPTITTNGTYTIPSGYTGFNNFTVNVPPTIVLDSLNYTDIVKRNARQGSHSTPYIRFAVTGYNYYLIDGNHTSVTLTSYPIFSSESGELGPNRIFALRLYYTIVNNKYVVSRIEPYNNGAGTSYFPTKTFTYTNENYIIIQAITESTEPGQPEDYSLGQYTWKIGSLKSSYTAANNEILNINFVLSNFSSIPFQN